MSKKKQVKVLLPVMLPIDMLSEHPKNSQKQSKHIQAELRKSIEENGFDESLLVAPKKDGEGYWIVAGNHRFRAGKDAGMYEFPCVVQKDWDSIQQQLELVRRNYVRGKIDREAFTHSVNSLSIESHMSLEAIYEGMGFEDEDAFKEIFLQIQEEEKKEEQVFEKLAKEAASSDSGVIKLIDDIGYVVSTLVAKHGHTVPHSFIIFPTGGKNHMYIASNPTLKKHLESIAGMCASQNLDINVALAGILAVGIHETGFTQGQGRDKVVEALEADGDSDLDLI